MLVQVGEEFWLWRLYFQRGMTAQPPDLFFRLENISNLESRQPGLLNLLHKSRHCWSCYIFLIWICAKTYFLVLLTDDTMSLLLNWATIIKKRNVGHFVWGEKYFLNVTIFMWNTAVVYDEKLNSEKKSKQGLIPFIIEANFFDIS